MSVDSSALAETDPRIFRFSYQAASGVIPKSETGLIIEVPFVVLLPNDTIALFGIGLVILFGNIEISNLTECVAILV